MHELANRNINQGLSLGARLLLGTVASLFGGVMFLSATPEHLVGFYGFGAFCFFIAIACFTKGRVRQFIGSSIGCTIFIVGIVYLATQLYSGTLFTGRRAEPSAFNALLYLLFIGIPGAAYAYKVRFGFRKAP